MVSSGLAPLVLLASTCVPGRSELFDAQERRRPELPAEPRSRGDAAQRGRRLLVEDLPGPRPGSARRRGLPQQPDAPDRRRAGAPGPRPAEPVDRESLPAAAGGLGGHRVRPDGDADHDQPLGRQPPLLGHLGDRRLGQDPPGHRGGPGRVPEQRGDLRRRPRHGHRGRGLELRQRPHGRRAAARRRAQRRDAEGEPPHRLGPVQVRRDERAGRAPGRDAARPDERPDPDARRTPSVRRRTRSRSCSASRPTRWTPCSGGKGRSPPRRAKWRSASRRICSGGVPTCAPRVWPPRPSPSSSASRSPTCIRRSRSPGPSACPRRPWARARSPTCSRGRGAWPRPAPPSSFRSSTTGGSSTRSASRTRSSSRPS